MAISQDFAPPFKLIAPYFIIGISFFVLSVALLFGIEIENLTNLDTTVIAWVHIFLLGFVMMVIFGAMAQLVPVVLEVGHFGIDLYYIIYPLLFVGTILMACGFQFVPALLPYGGVVVLISLLIFVFETFMSIKKVKKLNLVITSIILANSFLFIGLVFGLVMALGYAGIINVDIHMLLRAHVYLVFIGYVGVTIMGMSMILLPMFWLSHNFSTKSVKYALYFLAFGVTAVVLSSVLKSQKLEYLGYFLTILALFFYFYQIYIIYKKRVRIEKDIYLKSVVAASVSLLVSLITGVVYIFFPSPNLLLAIGWILIFGYVALMIIGHLYKIVPFLVWYERFSPLVGKQKVPMLADMLPKKSANFQFLLSGIGIVTGFVSFILNSNEIFIIGVNFLFIGCLFVLKDLLYMINFKG
ncbi:hypothetical protein KKG72_05440 [bacterium]|nr:hypothetical protein [bacterium]MBU1993543.1 hypothetical protein [bacterium]